MNPDSAFVTMSTDGNSIRLYNLRGIIALSIRIENTLEMTSPALTAAAVHQNHLRSF